MMRLLACQVGLLLVMASMGTAENSLSSPWSGWALITPVLGDLSPACVEASQNYINNLSGAFQVGCTTRGPALSCHKDRGCFIQNTQAVSLGFRCLDLCLNVMSKS